ncbi:hypothetical protein [Caenispirillum salinarum]
MSKLGDAAVPVDGDGCGVTGGSGGRARQSADALWFSRRRQ